MNMYLITFSKPSAQGLVSGPSILYMSSTIKKGFAQSSVQTQAMSRKKININISPGLGVDKIPAAEPVFPHI